MSSYIVNGPNCLKGEITLQGCKNAALPIMAACLLNGKENIIYNVPKIRDVETMKKILFSLGCKVKSEGNALIIDSSSIDNLEVSEKLVRQMRSSIILIGALISKHKKTKFSYPGGCDIGLRPIDLHLKGLSYLGVKITEEHGYIICEGNDLRGCNIQLDYPSVGATENIMLASVYAKGVTSIGNAAKEPEIIDLQNFLNRMGARVYGAGTNTVYIEGVEKLDAAEYSVMSDRIAAGTYMCAAHITGGEIFLRNCSLDTMKSTYYKLVESGLKITGYTEGVSVKSSGGINAVDSLITLPYPGFPTDMQSPFVAMLTVANGTSFINETIFENRYKYVSQLTRMGADIKAEGRVAVVKGVKRLSGANVYAQDLRGGAAITLAALTAEGRSLIDDVEYIERGYENFADNLRSLNANIKMT